MKNLTLLKTLTFLAASTALIFLAGCGDDDEGSVVLNFEGEYAIVSATDNDGNLSDEEVLGLLEAALLADNPCNPAIAGNFPTLTLVNGASSITSGDLLNTCSAEALSEPGGTWQYNASNATFALSLVVDSSPVPVPLQQTNVVITNDPNGDVTSVTGDINLSSVIPGFPPSVSLVIARI